jgi:hypothetical protein
LDFQTALTNVEMRQTTSPKRPKDLRPEGKLKAVLEAALLSENQKDNLQIGRSTLTNEKKDKTLLFQ